MSAFLCLPVTASPVVDTTDSMGTTFSLKDICFYSEMTNGFGGDIGSQIALYTMGAASAISG